MEFMDGKLTETWRETLGDKHDHTPIVLVDAFVMHGSEVTNELVRSTGFGFLRLIVACQQTQDSHIIENVRKFISKEIGLADDHQARLEDDLRTAYDQRTTDSQAGPSNGPLEVLLAGMRVLKDPKGFKRTYGSIPRDRSLSSAIRKGNHTGCSIPTEILNSKQLEDIVGPHVNFFERLLHETTTPYREFEEQRNFTMKHLTLLPTSM